MLKQSSLLKHSKYLASTAVVAAMIAGGTLAISPHYGHRLAGGIAGVLTLAASGQSGYRDVVWQYANSFAMSVSLPIHTRDSEPSVYPLDERTETVKTVAISDTADLDDTFQRMGYRLDDPEEGTVEVPRLIVTKLPRDLSEIDEPDSRKTLFVQVTLPLILQANEAILKQRDRVIALRARVVAGERITEPERRWLDGVEAYYAVAGDDFGQLLNRIDVVPPSLALAQAAIESGWGTSRYALEGNALFGEYTTNRSAGLRPDALPDKPEIRIRTFGGLLEAVFSYAHNLNTHPAYQAFRTLRAKQRDGGDTPDGFALAQTLLRYSTRGEDYIHDIQSVIRANELDLLDDAMLKDSEVTRVVLGNT